VSRKGRLVAMASRRRQRPLVVALVGAVLLAFTGMECAAAAAGTDVRNSRDVAALGESAAVARHELQQGPGGDTHAERRQRLRDRIKSKATQHQQAPAAPKLVPAKSAEKPTSFQEAPSFQEAAAAAAAAGSGSSTTPSKAAPAKARRSGGEMFNGSKRGARARMMFPHIEGAVTDDKNAWETGKRSRLSPPPPREVDDYADDKRKKGRVQEAGEDERGKADLRLIKHAG